MNQKNGLIIGLVALFVILVGAGAYFAVGRKPEPVAQQPLPTLTQATDVSKPNPLPTPNQTETPVSPAPTLTANANNLKEINVCGVNIEIPSFVKGQLVKDADFTPSGSGGTKAVGCKYQTPDFDFSVLVLDKNEVPANEQFWQEKFNAFDKYQQNQNISEINNFSRSDTFSTGMAGQQLYKNLNNNTVGYTAEIYQDIPGSGVYQAVAEVSNSYLVYITYVLFNLEDKAWNDYFDARWSAEKNNGAQVFDEYMTIMLKDKAIVDKINELNNIALNIK